MEKGIEQEVSSFGIEKKKKVLETWQGTGVNLIEFPRILDCG